MSAPEPERFTPYALGDGGYGVWDAVRGRRVEQPGLRDSHWFPNEARAQAWINRQRRSALVQSRRSRRGERG